MLSTISIKDAPKRKQKVLFKRAVAYSGIFLSIFVISFLILTVISYRAPTILSPIPVVFSQVLNNYEQKNLAVVKAEVQNGLEKRHISFSSISVEGSTIHVHFDDAAEALLSTNNNIDSQLDSLQVTIAHLTIEGKHISLVDVRFERPVVTFQ